MSTTASPVITIINKIVNGVHNVWSAIVTEIDGDAAKVRAMLPASALPNFDAAVADVKQGASDVLGLMNAGMTGAEPALVVAVEKALDDYIGVASGGLALPAVPLVNGGITRGADMVTKVASAWLLKQQAALTDPAAKGEPAPAVEHAAAA